jgi:hypothetical protein
MVGLARRGMATGLPARRSAVKMLAKIFAFSFWIVAAAGSEPLRLSAAQDFQPGALTRTGTISVLPRRGMIQCNSNPCPDRRYFVSLVLYSLAPSCLATSFFTPSSMPRVFSNAEVKYRRVIR